MSTKEKRFKSRAATYPVNPPINMVGAKMPPTPPLPVVAVIAIGFNTRTSTKNMRKMNRLSWWAKKMLPWRMEETSPERNSFTISYPSPYKGGKRRTRIPSATPPVSTRTQTFPIAAKRDSI